MSARARARGRRARALPALQVNLAQIAEVIDRYIRERLFGEPFDPFAGSDWKILLCYNSIVTEHVVQQVGRLVLEIERGAFADLCRFAELTESGFKGEFDFG